MTSNNISISFEFFPPKTPKGEEKLKLVRQQLGQLRPDYFSVTYGAGGSTRDNTKKIVLDGLNAGFNTAPHLSFGGDDEDTILNLLNDYKKKVLKKLLHFVVISPQVLAQVLD